MPAQGKSHTCQDPAYGPCPLPGCATQDAYGRPAAPARKSKASTVIELRGAKLRATSRDAGALYVTATDYDSGEPESPEAVANGAMLNALARALTSVSDAESERWLQTLRTVVVNTRDILGPLFVPAP